MDLHPRVTTTIPLIKEVVANANGLELFDNSDPSQLILMDEFDTEPEDVGEGVFLGEPWGYIHISNPATSLPVI